MVLSNTKLKRRKREEAAAVAALAPPPDSNATPSTADVVMSDSPAVLSAKKKKRPKGKKANGGEGNGTVVDAPVEGDNDVVNATSKVGVEGDIVQEEGVKQSEKKRKDAPEVTTQEPPLEADNGAEKLPSSAGEDAGVPEVSGAVGEATVGAEVPKTKNRKKPRWEVDENGKRKRPNKPEGEDASEGTKASTSPDKGTEKGDDTNGSAEKNGDAATVAPDGDRMHQGDEPWLQSKRSKKKKKLLDKWGKKIEDAAVVADEQAVNEEAPQNGSSTEEKVDPKKVMVGGMPYYITEDDIHEFFKECGTIAELDCMTFPDTGKFKGIAFITFRTEEAAKRALELDGADMGGRFLKIEICKIRPREPSKKDMYKEPPKKHEGCLSAYIGNLSWDITEKELRKFFKGCKIDSIRFATNKDTGEFRGFGHVDFADDESLETAMKLDQMPVLDRPLKIAYSVPQKNKPLDANPARPGAKKGCFNCGEEGHMSYNCPKKI
ncbi:hypothetical protein KC19_2G124400 [Ceratodon purpureus]|uniref:Uncharacterized protein n=1 Tax=Ceratodon purpureus TaxID=3225 RepID=A0A8T0IT42_CERPU|nr:hypothetical protein KC19_2G124400 [Ceratodon purpureus]